MGPQSKHVYGAAGSNGLGPKTEHAYRVLGSHGLGQQSERAHELQDFTGWDIRGHMHTELQDLTGTDLRPNMHTELQDWGCRISRVRHTRSNMPARYQDGAAGSHGLETPDRTCLQGIRTGLQDLTGKDHQIVRAYAVSGWGMHDLTGKEQQFQHAYEVTGRGCRISRVRNIRSNMPTRYQVGAAGFHGLGTTDRTCLLCIGSGLQDLTGSKHQIERIYEVSHGFGTTDHTCLRGIRTGLQHLTCSEHQIVERIRTGLQDLTDMEHQIAQKIHHAYKV